VETKTIQKCALVTIIILVLTLIAVTINFCLQQKWSDDVWYLSDGTDKNQGGVKGQWNVFGPPEQKALEEKVRLATAAKYKSIRDSMSPKATNVE